MTYGLVNYFMAHNDSAMRSVFCVAPAAKNITYEPLLPAGIPIIQFSLYFFIPD